MANNNLKDKALIKAATNAFFSTQVKELLPSDFWADSEVKGFRADRNLLLDMYGKTEDDDFTLWDMFDSLISEYPYFREEKLKDLPSVSAGKTRDTLYYLSFAKPWCDESGLTLEKALETTDSKESLRYIFYHLNCIDFFNYLLSEGVDQNVINDTIRETQMFFDTCWSKEFIGGDTDFPADSIGCLLECAVNVYSLPGWGFIGGLVLEEEFVSIEREATRGVDNVLKLPFMALYTEEGSKEPKYREMLIPVPVERR